MCEIGWDHGCINPDAFLVMTNRIADPAQTTVKLGACRDHLAEAVTEQLGNNSRLGEQGMRTPPGLRLGHLDRDVTVIALGPACAVCGEPLERVDLNGPDEWVHAGDEPAGRHAPVLPGSGTGDDIADAASLSRVESSACDR